MQLATQNTK